VLVPCDGPPRLKRPGDQSEGCTFLLYGRSASCGVDRRCPDNQHVVVIFSIVGFNSENNKPLLRYGELTPINMEFGSVAIPGVNPCKLLRPMSRCSSRQYAYSAHSAVRPRIDRKLFVAMTTSTPLSSEAGGDFVVGFVCPVPSCLASQQRNFGTNDLLLDRRGGYSNPRNCFAPRLRYRFAVGPGHHMSD
jgi:hypothetical protein